MNKTIQTVQTMYKNNIKDLNTEYEHYKDYLSTGDQDRNYTVAELIRDADIDSIEFNIGFEQGYLRALEEIINLGNGNELIVKELRRIINGIEGDTFTADNIQALINKLNK